MTVFMWWTDFSDYGSSVFLEAHMGVIRASILIPWEVVVGTLSFHGLSNTRLRREDNLINNVVVMTKRLVFNRDPRVSLTYGMVDLYTELKTTHQEIHLLPREKPIVIRFEKKQMNHTKAQNGQDMLMRVLEAKNKVVDSTCIIFAVARTDRYNLTLGIETNSRLYNFSFAALPAKYPSEYLNFIGAKFVEVTDKVAYFMPRAPKYYKFEYPMSRFFFMLRVPTVFGTGFGQPSIQKAIEQDSDFYGHLLRKKRDMAHPDFQPLLRNYSLVDKRNNVTITVKIHRSDCFYLYKKSWRTDKKCQSVPSRNPNEVKCNCYVSAVYSAKKGLAMEHLRDFEPRVLDYYGPTLLPAFFILICLIIALFYCYWAFFQDVQEMECLESRCTVFVVQGQTHVVKNVYHPDSPEQFLVCINTGAMPGSGTVNRVSFLLVGEVGSTQLVKPEGKFCFSTGSEIWFLMSSDLVIGHIVGVTINNDRIVSGSDFHPWILKRVVVYSRRFNHVIVFEANKTLGIHLPSLVLPSVPHRSKRGAELFIRFWNITKTYHIVGSVVFHVPGRGVSRWQNALSSLTVLMTSAGLAIETLGPPKPVYHLNVLHALGVYGYAAAILRLSSFTFCLAIFLKLLFSLIFRKRVGVIWYSQLGSQDIVWQGPPKNPQVVETWLTNKRPLSEEPEVNPKWLIRRLYFPQWLARHMAKIEARKERARAKGEREPGATEQQEETEPPARLNIKSEAGAKQAVDSRSQPDTAVWRSVARDVAEKTPVKPKEAEKLSSNVQTASGTKHEDDSTIRFGVGLGIRKRSEVSTSVDGAPLKVVGSLSSKQVSYATFSTHNLTLSKEGSYVVSETSVGQESSQIRLTPETSADSNVNRGGSCVKESETNERSCREQVVDESQDSQINSVRESTLNTINPRPNETRVDRSDITCLEISQRRSLKPDCFATNRFRLYVSALEKVGLHPFESQHQELTIPNLTFVSETEPSLSSASLSTKLEKCETVRSRMDSKRHTEDQLSKQGTQEDHLIEQGTQEDQLNKQGTQEDQHIKQGTQNDQLSKQGTQQDHLIEQGTQEDQLSKQGTKEDHLIEQGTRKDQVTENGTIFCSSDSERFHDETSNDPSESTLLTSCAERSMLSQKEEESNVFKSIPTFGHIPRTVSFRHFYFRPMIIKGPKPGQWHRVSNVYSNVRFLRKARYLEKLVKDYDLDTMIPSPRPASCLSSELGRDGEERSSGELASREGKASNVSVADRDGVCLCEKYCSLLYQEKPLESISATGEDTSPTKYHCTSNATGRALLDKRKRKSEARRFSKLASVWPGIKCSFLGSLIRRISSLSGRGRKEKNLESSCAGQSSVSEACMSLSAASLVQPTRSDPQGQAPSCCGELDTDSVHAAHSKSTLRDQNRSAQMASHPSSQSTDVDTAEEGSEAADRNSIGYEVSTSVEYPVRRTRWKSQILDAKSRPGCCLRLCYRICDFFLTFWSLKIAIVKMLVLLICVLVTILGCGWVCVNSIYYSLQQGVEWFLVLLIVLLLEALLLEPLVFLVCAFISSQLWKTPHIINECLQRFKTVTDDLFYRDWMIYLSVADRHLTSIVHHQAAPASASLFHLHDKIHKALKRVIGHPDVVFHTGVYWLIIYTACILVLVNTQTDVYQSHMQATYIGHKLGLAPSRTQQPIDVDKMWTYIEDRFRIGLIHMEASLNQSVIPWRTLNVSKKTTGSMLFTSVRLKQIRAKRPPVKECSPLPVIQIDQLRQCNYALTKDNMETGDFGFDWTDVINKGFHNRWSYLPDGSSMFGVIDLLPRYGFWEAIFFDQDTTLHSLKQIRHSNWIDENTRFLVLDFSIVNFNSHIASSYRITFDFKRSAPFWSSTSFHFRYEQPGNQYYYMILVGVIFLNISTYNIVKELMLVYKTGVCEYLTQIDSYTEILKVLLSFLLCYVYFRKMYLSKALINDLKYSYLLRDTTAFVDFFEMAMMDYLYTVAGGFLAFVCISQIFVMLSKIRRLLVFIRLLYSAVTLFYMPLIVGMGFAFLSNNLFGKTNENFSSFAVSYLMINQYFIKPRAIYESLTEAHPYIGPYFVFFLGFCINLFMLNFFIAFLNEAYSSIQNQVRIESYKVREKTKLEYVYEFLGIQSTITWDIEDDIITRDKAKDRDFMADIKRLRVD
ncbi:hypothetical protein RRG08_036812 [Elysia crispata]|uniref:PLAT domain-containing protein n=1 Tax=Elysia crispata TaxID=231223 RepID=A0AAE0Y962_9GAST|nr:hypothetical protein RRG08_036812 [Elysia crispata]